MAADLSVGRTPLTSAPQMWEQVEARASVKGLVVYIH
jgi:hypothetical protein